MDINKKKFGISTIAGIIFIILGALRSYGLTVYFGGEYDMDSYFFSFIVGKGILLLALGIAIVLNKALFASIISFLLAIILFVVQLPIKINFVTDVTSIMEVIVFIMFGIFSVFIFKNKTLPKILNFIPIILAILIMFFDLANFFYISIHTLYYVGLIIYALSFWFNSSKTTATTNPALLHSQAIDPTEEIKKFKQLLDSGVISEEEFNKKKKDLLGL